MEAGLLEKGTRGLDNRGGLEGEERGLEAGFVHGFVFGENRVQCKDIPDSPILYGLLKHPGWHSHWEPDGGWTTVRSYMPPLPHNGDKLACAKMVQLKRRGLVDGCPCGCRGDWELTEKGERLANQIRIFAITSRNLTGLCHNEARELTLERNDGCAEVGI